MRITLFWCNFWGLGSEANNVLVILKALDTQQVRRRKRLSSVKWKANLGFRFALYRMNTWVLRNWFILKRKMLTWHNVPVYFLDCVWPKQVRVTEEKPLHTIYLWLFYWAFYFDQWQVIWTFPSSHNKDFFKCKKNIQARYDFNHIFKLYWKALIRNWLRF